MVPMSQGDRASGRAHTKSNGRYSLPHHCRQDPPPPTPLSPEGCGKHVFWGKFWFLHVYIYKQFSSGTASFKCLGPFRRSLEDTFTLTLFSVVCAQGCHRTRAFLVHVILPTLLWCPLPSNHNWVIKETQAVSVQAFCFCFLLQWYQVSPILLSTFSSGFTPRPLRRRKACPCRRSIAPSFCRWCRPHPCAYRNK